MRITRTLQPNERAELIAEGEFVYLRAANAPIDVQVNNQTPITLDVRDQIQTAAIDSLIVINRSNDANPITLEVGHGRFVSSGDGRSIAINNFPTLMHVEQVGPVRIDNWPNQQAVSVTNWPSSQNVSIANWKSVQAVKQSGDWTATIANLPDVQKVSVQNQPAAPSAMNSEVITIASGAGTVAKNTKRSKVILKAGTSNKADISIDKFPLSAGDMITLSTTAALALTGTDGDQLFYIEDVQA